MADPSGSSCCRVLSVGRKPGLRRWQKKLMAVAKISNKFEGIFTEIGVPVQEKFHSAILFLTLKVDAYLSAQCN